MAELSAQLRVVEVRDPFRIVAGLSTFEDSHRFTQRLLATNGVAAAGQRAGLHCVEVCGQGRGRLALGAGARGAREVRCLAVAPEERGLVTHCVEDAAREED